MQSIFHDYGPVQPLNKCVEIISDIMFHSYLQLNKDKTEIIIFGTKKEQLNVRVHLEALKFKTFSHARNLV